MTLKCIGRPYTIAKPYAIAHPNVVQAIHWSISGDHSGLASGKIVIQCLRGVARP